jgi:hypothetical protein
MNNNRICLAFKKSAITVTVEGENTVKLSHIGFEDKKIFDHVVKFSDLKRVLSNAEVETSSMKITKDDTRTLKVRIDSIDELGKIALTGYCTIQDYIVFIEKVYYLMNGKEIKSYPVSIDSMKYNLTSVDIATVLYLLKNGIIGHGLSRDRIYYTNVFNKTDGKYDKYVSFDISIKDEKYTCIISSGNVREITFKEQPAYILDRPEEFAEKCFNNRHEVINFIGKLCITI